MESVALNSAEAAPQRKRLHLKPNGANIKLLQAGITSAAVLLVIHLSASTTRAAPTAQEILASARQQVARQQVEVQGQLRENGAVIPFRLTQTGPVIRYSFTNPDEALQLRLGDTDSRLEEITREGIDKISGAEFDQKVRGTAITYEDLALKFIYWPNARVLGQDYINTRRVWKLELLPPGRQSQYSRVFLWCEEQSGALMRMEGFDWNGKLVRRFEVVSVQQIEGHYFLKQMRIEALQPESGKVQARTYLEIKK
ncbi:MAG: outer membrane lipoprotein-sorting protein [Verrucomicrobiota bacterium]|nr:outer membrane lipoprotein-sorting protein [Verrucomicrobiota bacterium]